MRTLHLDVDSDLHAPRVLRHALRAWLEAVDCTDDTKFDVVLLVSELASDAVHKQATRVSAVMSFEHGRLRVDLDDDRPAQTPIGHRGPRRSRRTDRRRLGPRQCADRDPHLGRDPLLTRVHRSATHDTADSGRSVGQVHGPSRDGGLGSSGRRITDAAPVPSPLRTGVVASRR